ncbi:MAG: hypothetical protein RJA07_2168 [Bacteroidota bacterium]|jgi:uncharacterized protein (DUF849 family)
MDKYTNLNSTTNGIKNISSTLKTLCILTFIGVGMMNFFGAAYHYYTIDKNIVLLQQQLKATEYKDNDAAISTMQDALDGYYKARENKMQNLWIDIIAGILCAVGAAMMMRLLKNGFFVYTIGELLPVIYHFIVFGFGKVTFSAITSAFLVVIPLTFIVLYAVQLKDME